MTDRGIADLNGLEGEARLRAALVKIRQEVERWENLNKEGEGLRAAGAAHLLLPTVGLIASIGLGE